MGFALQTKPSNLWQKFHRSPLSDTSQFNILIGAILCLFCMSTQQLGYNRQWRQFPRYIFTRDETGCCADPLRVVLVVIFPAGELWFTVAGMYLMVIMTPSFIFHWMEHRFNAIN
jgi:hypothetical protein